MYIIGGTYVYIHIGGTYTMRGTSLVIFNAYRCH